MRAAIGNSLLLNIVVIIVSAVMLIFVGSLAYSKAYKVKNRIVSVLEKYTFTCPETEQKAEEMVISPDAKSKINADLSRIGYSIATSRECEPGYKKAEDFNYCYKVENANNGCYYKIITYTHFDIPIIGQVLQFPVKGETKILNKNYNYK